jgi:hypothetical protein
MGAARVLDPESQKFTGLQCGLKESSSAALWRITRDPEVTGAVITSGSPTIRSEPNCHIHAYGVFRQMILGC